MDRAEDGDDGTFSRILQKPSEEEAKETSPRNQSVYREKLSRISLGGWKEKTRRSLDEKVLIASVLQ